MPPSTKHPEQAVVGSSDMTQVGVVIPTYNAEPCWETLHCGISRQGLAPRQVLIIDSSSQDRTRKLAEKAGYRVLRIEQAEFSHGGTRQFASEILPWARILIYLTQDAFPSGKGAFRRLCGAFSDLTVGAAYGRQLPREKANAIERHARLFNYPKTSSVRTFDDRKQIGIKAAFLSNSFAAYRRSALEAIGGFPTHVIIAEDSVVAARLLIAGWKVAYVAEAAVVHSHPLTLREEFSRYFDTGVHHARESWLLDSFGRAGEEGKRFLRSELDYLRATNPQLIPLAAIRTLNKLVAYNLGLREHRLALPVKAHLSSQPGFWKQPSSARAYVEDTAEVHIHSAR